MLPEPEGRDQSRTPSSRPSYTHLRKLWRLELDGATLPSDASALGAQDRTREAVRGAAAVLSSGILLLSLRQASEGKAGDAGHVRTGHELPGARPHRRAELREKLHTP